MQRLCAICLAIGEYYHCSGPKRAVEDVDCKLPRGGGIRSTHAGKRRHFGLWCQLIGWSARVALYDVAKRTNCVFDRVFAC